MKLFRIAVIFCTIALFCASASAGQKNLKFTILKDTIEADLAGFTLYEYDAAHVSTGRTFVVPYTGQADIIHSEVITVPDNAVTKLCYTVDAYDFSGNNSDQCAIVDDPSNPLNSCVEIDFQPPGGATVTVTIELVPE
jgi:hypothetical protein